MSAALTVLAGGIALVALARALIAYFNSRDAFSEGYEIGLNKGFHIGREQARRKRGKDGRFLPNPWKLS